MSTVLAADVVVCVECGRQIVGDMSYVTAVVSQQVYCLGCSPLAIGSPREFVRCRAELVQAGHVLAYRDHPGRWQGIQIIDVKTKVAEIGGLLTFRVRIFLATGQVLEVAPGDLVPLRPARQEAR